MLAAIRSLDKSLSELIILADENVNSQSPQYVKDLMLARKSGSAGLLQGGAGGLQSDDTAVKSKFKWVSQQLKDDQREARMLKRACEVWDNQAFSSKARFLQAHLHCRAF